MNLQEKVITFGLGVLMLLFAIAVFIYGCAVFGACSF